MLGAYRKAIRNGDVVMRSEPAVLAAVVAAVLAAAGASAQSAQELTGDWSGDLVTPDPGVTVPVVITFSTDAAGALEGQIESPTQRPGHKSPLAKLTLAGGSLSFDVPDAGASYAGTWNASSHSWSGTLTQGVAMKLDLARRPPAEQAR
jgi:hypothetical protein